MYQVHNLNRAMRRHVGKALRAVLPKNAIPFSPFGFYAQITKAVESEEGDWCLEGPLSDPGRDIQGEEMDQGIWGRSGLRKGLATFKALGGVVDVEHQYEKTRDPTYIVGQGVELFDAPHPVTKAIVPWLRVRLFKAKAWARKVWEHLQAGGTLGFSVAGAAIRKAGSRILDTIITTVGITAVPVASANAGCIRMCKALDYYADWAGDLGDVRLPMPPELTGYVMPLFRALQATGDLPHRGPGVSALMTEDLGGQMASSEPDEDEALRAAARKKRSRKKAAMRKALAWELGEALSERLACASLP